MTIVNFNIKALLGLCLSFYLLLPGALRAELVDVTVPFQYIDGLIILEAEVDGITGNYLFDTGADAVLIDGQPKQANQQMVTPQGEISIASHELTQLKIGSFIQRKISARIICLDALKKHLGIELNGIIGGGYFKPYILTMDFEQSTITISSTPIKKEAVKDLSKIGFKMVNQIPIVEVTLEGKTYDFAMDSGATVHFMDEKVLSHISSASKIEESSTILTYDQTTLSRQRFVLNKFTIGSINFSGHHCLSQNLDAVNSSLERPISGILSLSQLAQEKVVLDFKNNAVYF